MFSFGMLSARAARIAARRRGFMLGSGRPILAATVISRASLPNSLDLMASCRPLRCMMFLNCEWPAKASLQKKPLPPEHANLGNAARFIGPRWTQKLAPKTGPCLREPPAEPHRRDACREARGIVGLDRNRAKR